MMSDSQWRWVIRLDKGQADSPGPTNGVAGRRLTLGSRMREHIRAPKWVSPMQKGMAMGYQLTYRAPLDCSGSGHHALVHCAT